ncbi:type II toxin-antitoxin system RelE/ParE family toxin [Acetobacter sp. TBRC 12305]|uniref:Type II toxin-antitoxin system RelE/ParE family toxin n=1 Tax=Acetobacter garciniae TaxID=2817435 RepID=A0A939KS33_9PROT|nr:type II toxin-antitoxin system RelE/ParE family toxin [Acetobacter garciniae]MBO1326816.1 type II toxin-antitoxin system RelE/ParE family toxin [Acetobacter garciniae]MBX0345932.1 type II toxin-antitoxin system RelE/ParE family toxin [Acetobacter garciniae]
MLPIVWTETADEDLASITERIGEDNIGAAERMWHRFRSCVLPLSAHPYLYPISDRIPGLREIVAHPNYVILYRVTSRSIEIVNVVHSRRQFPL